MISFDSAATMPLTSNALIHERVTELVGRAIQRQLWLLFLDEDDVQLPVVVPIDGLPASPPNGATTTLADFADAAEASSLVAVLERYGDDTLTAQDKAWARYLRTSASATSVALRGILLSHRSGVRWIAEEDYLL